MTSALYYGDNLAAVMEQIADQIAEHEAEFKALLCGGLTLVIARAIVRDLVVGISAAGDAISGSLRYARADHPIGYGILIIFKIANVIFFGAETLHLIGFIAADPVLILMRVALGSFRRSVPQGL